METIRDYIVFRFLFDREIKKTISCNSSIRRCTGDMQGIIPMNSNSCKYNPTMLECLTYEDIQKASHVACNFFNGEKFMEITLAFETGKKLPFVPFLFKQGFPVKAEPGRYTLKINNVFNNKISTEITDSNLHRFLATFNNDNGKSFEFPNLCLSMLPLDNSTLYLPFDDTYNEETDKVITFRRNPVRIFATDIHNRTGKPILAAVTLDDGTEEIALYGRNGRQTDLLIHWSDLFIERKVRNLFSYERMVQGYPIVTKKGFKAIPTMLEDNGTFTADIYLQGEVIEATYDKTGNLVEEDNDELTLIMEDCGNLKLQPFEIGRYRDTREKAVTRNGLKVMELRITEVDGLKETYAKLMAPDGSETMMSVHTNPDEVHPKFNDLLLIMENTVLN